MSSSREGFDLFERPELLFNRHAWRHNKKTIFSDTYGSLKCKIKGHRLYLTEDFDYVSIPKFVCGFVVIKHYWFACKTCYHYIPKEKITKKTKLI